MPLPRKATAEGYQTQGCAGRIRLRVFRPEMDTGNIAALLRHPGVLYLYGGGFMRSSINDADVPACHLAATLPAVAVTIGYSLASAVPFPAAPEGVHATPCCMADHAGAWGIDHRRIVVARCDADGNLLATLSMIARNRGSPHLHAQVLIAPMFDPTMARVRPDHLANIDNSAEIRTNCCRQYLPRLTGHVHPCTTPMGPHRLQSLSPALLLTTPQNLLRTKVEHYAACLIRVGAVTQVVRVDEARHGSVAMSAVTQGETMCFLRWHLGMARQVTVPRKHYSHADRKDRTSVDPTGGTPSQTHTTGSGVRSRPCISTLRPKHFYPALLSLLTQQDRGSHHEPVQTHTHHFGCHHTQCCSH